MVELLQRALEHHRIDDRIEAAGQFYPRGHTGGMFVGGLAGADAGGVLGAAGDAVGAAAGTLAGGTVAGGYSGLPDTMLIGVSDTAVYGFAGASRRKEPTKLAFRIPREGLTTKVHQRLNVRVLELIHEDSDSRIELEGNRLPVTHSKDVIQALSV